MRKTSARANYMCDSTWVCQKTVTGWRGSYTFYQGRTYHIPYEQPVYAGYYIGYSISVDDFLAATEDANSIFYTAKSNYAGKTSTYYANDCSAYVSWCWGINRQTTATIPNVSTYIGAVNISNVTSKLQIGDCLNSNAAGHVVLVTGLTYNASGLTQICGLCQAVRRQLYLHAAGILQPQNLCLCPVKQRPCRYAASGGCHAELWCRCTELL